MKLDAGLHNQSTASAISSARPNRRMGTSFMSSAIASGWDSSMPDTIGVSIIPGQIALIRIPLCAYPGIQLEISVYDRTVNIIEERFDFGIRFGDILEGGVVARPLMKPFREGLYASSAYLSEHGTPEVPSDLSQHKLIGYRFITNNRILPLILNDRGEQLTVEMPGQLISNDIDVMADGIRNGLGIGRLFEPIWQLQPDRELFIPAMESHWKTYPPVYLYYPKNAGKTKRVKALIDLLISATER